MLAVSAVAQVGPGNALRFDGTNTYLTIPHAAAQDAFPLTTTAWIRTTNQDAVVRSVISKYFESSLNGWAMFMYGGHLRAWYFRNGTNYVWDGGLGLDGGNIADGRWHHASFMVDATGGTLFVDGARIAFRSWTLSSGGVASGPGPSTTTEPLQIGRYWTYTTPFRGDMDEVTLWNQALGTNGINYIKHRVIPTDSDGLVAWYRFNEGAGTITADSTPSARTATMFGGPQWVTSTAPVALAPVANRALKLDGASGQVVIPHDPNQNVFPFTFMAWVKTSQAVGIYPAIAGKYAVNSVNGWGVALNQGRLHCWYYNSANNFLEPGYTNATDRFIADGQWHHVAFVVDATSGRLFIDGQLARTEPWTGTAGPTTSATPIRLGTYTSSAAFLNGLVDHVSIWNASSSQSNIVGYSRLPLTGSEAGLVAAYDMDEASGTSVLDLTGHYPGTGQGGFTRTGSIAYLGDGSQHLLASMDGADYTRLWAIKTSPTTNTFPIPARATIRRFHDFGDVPPPITIASTLSASLTDNAAQIASLNVPAESAVTFALPSENANAPATNSVTNLAATLNVNPVQLSSASSTYSATVSLSHTENNGPVLADGAVTLPLVRLLDFNGTLLFGSTETRFGSVANNPSPGLIGGGAVGSSLLINNNSGYLVTKPAYHFGNGLNSVNVNLFDDGHAIVTAGSLSVTGPVPDREVLHGITFDRVGLTISPANGTRANVILRYPLGFSTRLGGTSNRLTSAIVNFPNTLLDDFLIPQAATMTVTGPIYGIEETKPFWIQSPSLDWSLASGQLILNPPLTLAYVRQREDDALNTSRPTLTDPSAANRVSNDRYYHNITTATGSAVVRGDTNGAALLSIDAGLGVTELRPHFPYINENTGGHISVTGGRLLLTNDLIDEAASYVQISGPIPISYARDCADKSCSGLAVIGNTTLPFTTDTGALRFTRDGGLLGNGSVLPQNLTWGYLGGSDFAQRTSDVQAGGFHMPGTFLRPDQSTLASEYRPAVILYSGFGNPTNASYLERPDQLAYRAGLADYAGLNFRAPAQGHSILANKPSGWYPLVPQAKYYARFSGISGIHQAATFPSAMTLYGYAFTFTRYALSYRDSENIKSLTDGAISFQAQPSGFVQEFKGMKFLCRGGLDSADIPADLPPKHLNYWNTDFSPLTLQFRSQKNSTACNDLARKLVLGVEAKLPFIPQALHAALGFQPDGNLVTAADNIEGCDSRFPVPAELSLQGPGGSHYRISTASDGYFNNWAYADRPAAGFYNIAGKMDVFFFEDLKVHLHVTPTSPTAANIAVVGGWRALDKEGKDLGWSVGPDNFFTKAKFDPTHRGFPFGVPIGDYRDSASEVYHPRAQKDWIEVAKFDYPVVWNKGLRQFSSFEDSKVVLPVIDVSSRLKQLTPGKADIDFSQDLDLKLPRIKALDFVNDALDEVSGPINSLSNAVSQALGGAIDSTGLTRGLHGLQHTLRDQMDDFLRPVLVPALDPVVDRMLPLLANQLSTDAPNFLKNVSNIVANGTVDLKGSIRQINGNAGTPGSVVGQISKTLTDVDDTVDLLLRIVEKDGSGNRHAVRTLLQKIAEDQGPALGIAGGIADDTANGLLGDLEPTLAQLETDLRNIRSEFAKIKGQVTAASGDFNLALSSVAGNPASLDQYQKLAIAGLTNLFRSVITPAGDYFTANPNAAKAAIRERLIVTFFASTMPAKYQETFKQFLYDDDALLNTFLETLFQQINQSIRNAISSQLAGATDGNFMGMKGPGSFSQSLAAAKIRGAPTFNGDALRKIRLDADVQLNLGDQIHFTAYMQITELDSQSTPIECIPAGGPAAEVVIGARDVPLEWFGLSPIPPDKLTLSVEARWTLQGGSVIGIGGLFDVKGKVGLKGCSINEIGATLAIGEIENFFGAKAAGTVTILGIPVDITAGIFVGHACSLEPLIFIDPEAPKVLDNAAKFYRRLRAIWRQPVPL